MSVDIAYLRSFEDCMYMVLLIVEKSKSVAEIEREVKRLYKLIQQNKFEKIQNEFGLALL